MNVDRHSKVKACHLKRNAYLYIRQYALRQRAVAMGWPAERVVVIDHDQGQSGESTDREGFQKLVAEVGMGRAGIVLGLEVSRLVRNCADYAP